jgi:hypothetical protein
MLVAVVVETKEREFDLAELEVAETELQEVLLQRERRGQQIPEAVAGEAQMIQVAVNYI